jgi:F-type H+-transporting ATPase subunit b
VVQFDATILIQMINFVILLLVLNKVFYQPLIKIQTERRNSIEKARTGAEAKLNELNAYALVSEKIDAANQEREALLKQAQTEVEEKLNAVRQELNAQESALRQSLEAEIMPMAGLIINQLIDAKVGEASTEEREEVNA